MATALNGATTLEAAAYDSIEGVELLDKVVDIDQSPIGRTPRSNPATYTGIFTPIRELFSGVAESRARGYSPGRWLISTWLAIPVRASVITVKPWIFAIKARIFMKYWI